MTSGGNNPFLDCALDAAARGQAVFPTPPGHKTPFANEAFGLSEDDAGGFYLGTTDQEQIKAWWTRWPDANLAMRTGRESGTVVVDIDPRHGGDKTVEKLNLPNTRKVLTGGNDRGWQLHYQYPEGCEITSKNNVLGPGVDVKGEGGYVLLPPSVHPSGRSYEYPLEGAIRQTPQVVPLAPCPQLIIDKYNGNDQKQQGTGNADSSVHDPLPTDPSDNATIIAECLRLLKPERCDDYDTWLQIGLVCYNSKVPVELWDKWSQRSSKYEDGQCEKKWETFGKKKPERLITIGTLLFWASEDSGKTAAEILDGLGLLKKTRGLFRDHTYLAERFLADNYGPDSGTRLITRAGERFAWDAGRYIVVDDERLGAEICGWVKSLNVTLRKRYGFALNPTTTLTRNIAHCITAETLVAPHVEHNTWLDGKDRGRVISLENGLLYLDEKDAERRPKLKAHDPEYFTTCKLPYPYDPEAVPKVFLAFVRDSLHGREDYIALLQQWFGYVLLEPTLKFEKFLLMYGEAATGKTVATTVQQGLVGRENCCHVNLAQLAQPFALATLRGKLLNAMNETTHMVESEAENTIKFLTDGQAVTYQRKFLPAVTELPTAKIAITTNALPRFTDKSGGTWRRILLMPFDNVVPPELRVPGLAQTILDTELPGVLNWAIEGHRALCKAGRFIEPASSEELLEQYRRDSDPARAFLLENYTFAPNGYGVRCAELYAQYRQFCTAGGYHPLGERQFGNDVRRVFPETSRGRPRTDAGRAYVYVGLVPIAEPEFEETTR